jgi:hypothetical protein
LDKRWGGLWDDTWCWRPGSVGRKTRRGRLLVAERSGYQVELTMWEEERSGALVKMGSRANDDNNRKKYKYVQEDR